MLGGNIEKWILISWKENINRVINVSLEDVSECAQVVSDLQLESGHFLDLL